MENKKKERKTNANLVSMATKTPEERRELGRRGGIASGIAKRENKRFCQIIDEVFRRVEKYNGEDLTLKEKAVLKAAEQAAKGNLEALELLAKLNGESKEQIQIQALPPVQMTAFGFDD